jgi:hypothetical protein
VADGYVSGSRPQHFTINAADLEDDMDDAALERFYDEAVYEDSQQRITPESERVEEFVAWAKEQLAKREA